MMPPRDTLHGPVTPDALPISMVGVFNSVVGLQGYIVKTPLEALTCQYKSMFVAPELRASLHPN